MGQCAWQSSVFQKFMTVYTSLCIQFKKTSLLIYMYVVKKAFQIELSVLSRSHSKLATPANKGVHRNFS